MEIHRFEKLWTAVSILLIVGFISTVAYGAVGPGVNMVDDSGGTVDPDNLDNTPFAEPGVEQSGPNQFDVYVVAQRFSFSPGTGQAITVPAGSTVTFHITSSDVMHGFEVVGTNVNVMVIPGQVARITVEFDRVRTYGIVCNEYCGSGHHVMAGQLQVVEPSAYNGTEA